MIKRFFVFLLTISILFSLTSCGEEFTFHKYYNVTFDVNGGIELDESVQSIKYGSNYELPTPIRNNNSFQGWYYNDQYISNTGKWYISQDITLVAKWIEPYTENGKTYIDMGRYPQTLVSDEAIIKKLDEISKTNKLGYIEYKGEEYKKVSATPLYNSQTFINGDTIIKDEIYYFKVEPIKWRVLFNNQGTYKLYSEKALDVVPFSKYDMLRNIDGKQIYSNNYQYSNIRAWLNGYNGTSYNVDDYTDKGFINVAFNNYNQDLINNSLVDNSQASITVYDNPSVSDDTIDKIFLLSIKDAINVEYGFYKDFGESNRAAVITDYARSLGAEYMGQRGMLLLRSPGFNVQCVGGINVYGAIERSFECLGDYYSVCPALEITLE